MKVLSAMIIVSAVVASSSGGSALARATQKPKDPATDPRIERLLQLDDEQWGVVQQLIALSPEDWTTVEAVVASNRVGPVTSPVEPLTLADVVNTILARVNAIRTDLGALSARTPDRPDIRGLVAQVDLGNLRDMLTEVQDTMRGLLDIARDLRDGYDTFDAAQFRLRLEAVFADLESATTLYQRLQCVDDPDITIRSVSAAPIQRLIERAPGVVLYALSKILESIDPDWDHRISSVVDAMPSEVTGLCNDGLRPAAPRALDPDNIICRVLRPKGVAAALGVVKVKLSAGLIGFRFAKNHTKDEIQGTVGAEVVAGGTGGTSVKNPAHEAVEQWIDRLENLKDALKDLADRRKDCLDMDKDVESDLRDCAKDGCFCAAPLSVLLHADVSPSYAYVADLIDRRITLAEGVGLPDTAAARTLLEQARDGSHVETAEGYGLLCHAYGKLLPPTPRAVVDRPRVAE